MMKIPFETEHADRTWIRERRRMYRPQLLQGLGAIVAALLTGAIAIPDWLGVVFLVGGIGGTMLVISAILELVEARRLERRLRRGLDADQASANLVDFVSKQVPGSRGPDRIVEDLLV